MENIIEAKASVSNVGVTPRKARLVIDLVRGKSVSEAQAILKNVNNCKVNVFTEYLYVYCVII